MENWLARTNMLVGEENVQKLQNARVAIFGLGGVGGACVEALARCGVGSFALVDNDVVALSNLNRQLIATVVTVGMKKTLAAEMRILAINQCAQIKKFDLFYSKDTASQIDLSQFDYIIDAIDTISSKLELIENARSLGKKIISCMGTGNKLDPSRLKIADISQTSVCPLARVMRHELKKRSIKSLKVLFSDEPPITPITDEPPINTRKSTPASISFVPITAGMVIAGEVAREIMGSKKGR